MKKILYVDMDNVFIKIKSGIDKLDKETYEAYIDNWDEVTDIFGLKELVKSFDDSNLRNMRSFYAAFPIRDTLRHKLSWSHYRRLSRMDNEEKKATI